MAAAKLLMDGYGVRNEAAIMRQIQYEDMQQSPSRTPPQGCMGAS